MADDWDDWGDDDDDGDNSNSKNNNKSVAVVSNSNEKSEGWDWPSSNAEVAATTHNQRGERQQQEENSSPAAVLEQDLEARDAAVEEMTGKYFDELRKYLEDLADPSVREAINEELTKRDFASLAQYYDGRDDLAGYTLDTELQRMRYSVITEDGRRLGVGKAGIGGGGASSSETEEGEEGGSRCGGGGSTGGGGGGGGRGGGGGNLAVREFLSQRRGDTMLRMANQSIFADMLQAIQGRLLRPDLEISVISRDCEFFLDFSSGVLEAHSLFEVSTVGGGGPGARETLEIAHIKGTAICDTQAQACSQRLLSPQLRMVFDDDMRASAKVLALHSFMDGGMQDPGAGRGRGNNSGNNSSSFHRMGALQMSLARAGSDGMGRAAAAGTGLLANVVAGVGSAIGASRTGTVEGEFLADIGITGGGGGAGERGTSSASLGAAPLVQLYRRTDDTDEAAAPPAGRAAASARTNTSSGRNSSIGSSRGCAIGGPGGELPATSVGDDGADANKGGGHAIAVQSVLSSAGTNLPGIVPQGRHDSTGGNAFTGDAIADVLGRGGGGGGESDGAERRSALGMASATGGAVLRGLWGGVQSAAAAGAAVAAQVSAGSDERSATDSGGGGRNSEPPAPEFRLYRREGDM